MIFTHELINHASRSFTDEVHAAAFRDVDLSIGEIGGGANPLLPIEAIRAHNSTYTILDVSPAELAKAPVGYETVVADIAKPMPTDQLGRYDLIFSRFLAEHVADAEQFIENSFALLKEGGTCIHFFPTLFYPWFALNALMPARLSSALVRQVQPVRDFDGRQGKFPARYRGCRGPTGAQLRLYLRHGFTIDRFRAFYGTTYLARVPLLMRLESRVARRLRDRQAVNLTSYAIVVLRRPGVDASVDRGTPAARRDHRWTAPHESVQP